MRLCWRGQAFAKLNRFCVRKSLFETMRPMAIKGGC
jgi:hypothetical protein